MTVGATKVRERDEEEKLMRDRYRDEGERSRWTERNRW
jgi:hypothetical protein